VEGPIIFGLTPRAGRWNHRYLIPCGATSPELLLGRLADRARKADRGDDYIAVRRNVAQTATGRAGTELLVVQDDRLRHVGNAGRERLLAALRSYADRLETLVTETIDWEYDQPALVVERPELTAWREEASRLIASGHEASLGRRERPPRGWLRNAAAAVIVLGLLLLVAVFLWPPRNGCGPAPNKADSRKFKELANRLGVEPAPGAILRQLRLLFESPGATAPTTKASESADETSTPDAENSIHQILAMFYRCSFGREPPEAEDQLLKDQGLLDRLGELFPSGEEAPNTVEATAHQFDPCGLLKGDALGRENETLDRESLEGIDPIFFHEVVRTLHEIYSIGAGKVPKEGVYGAFFRDVCLDGDFLKGAAAITFDGRRPRFFFEADGGHAAGVLNLMRKPSLAKLLNADPQRNADADLRQLLGTVGAHLDQDSNRLLSERRLAQEKQERDGSKGFIEAFDALSRFVRAAHGAVSSRDSNSAR
jgi:hypothetical protein